MTHLNEEPESVDPTPEREQPVWNGVDADFYMPEDSGRGWFSRRRRDDMTDTAA